MSLLSSLNPLSVVSDAVESLCDAVLPQKLEFLGDAAGLLTDLETGNYLKCLEDAQDLFQDLPQQIGELTKNKGAAKGAGEGVDHVSGAPGGLDPTPPEPYSVDGSVTRGTPPETNARKTDKDTPIDQPTEPARARKTSNTSRVSGAAEGAPAASATESSKPKKTNGTKPSSTDASTSMSPDDFFKLSDKSLMDAVRDGKLPDAVKNDPEQMRRLQVRMEDIAQMNTIITNMLNAMHEMNKAIVQNLRV